MSLKFLLFATLMVLSAIEAKHFLKKIRDNSLSSIDSKLPQKVVDHLVRKRRAAEDSSSSSSSSEETTDEVAAAFMKFIIDEGWKLNKLKMLGGILDEMSDSDTNMTVIAWQRVLDGDGKFKEIRTIQLVIPPKPLADDAPHNIVQDEDEDEDESERILPHEDIKELREILIPSTQAGIPMSMTLEKFDDDGENEELIYMDQNQMYVHADYFAIYNKTEEANAQHVNDFVASLKPKALGKPSVLKYDVNGHLEKENSNFRPQYLGSVISNDDAPKKILTEGPSIISEIAYEYSKSEIPKQLAARYNKEYPDYRWNVLTDPEHYHLTRDVEMLLSYDNFDFDEFSDISFLVYGAKK